MSRDRRGNWQRARSRLCEIRELVQKETGPWLVIVPVIEQVGHLRFTTKAQRHQEK